MRYKQCLCCLMCALCLVQGCPVNELHPLGKLIQGVMDRNGWSLRGLSKQAADAGFSMSHTNLGRIKDDPVTSMKAETIRMLAQILRVPESRVTQAVLESMGIAHQPLTDSPSLVEVVRTSTEISERDRRIITSVLDAMSDTRSEANRDNQDKLQTNPPGKRTLRAVGSSGEAVKGQKIPHPDDPDFETPPPLEQLAAHPYFKTEHEKFEEAHGERGEENQDPDDR